MADKELAIIARSLALALKHWARDRRDEDRKEIAALHTDLVRAFNIEQQQIKEQEKAAQEPETPNE